MSTVLSLDPTMAAAVLIALLPLALAEPSHLIGHSTLGLHPTGVSYSNRSPQGLHGYHHGAVHHGFGKREAEPYYAGHGYLVAAHHPVHHAIGYGVYHHGYGKRSPTHRDKRPKRPKSRSYRPRYYYYRRRG